MYAALIDYNGQLIRSSFHPSMESAKRYAEANPGVVAVEEIGKGIVWERVVEGFSI